MKKPNNPSVFFLAILAILSVVLLTSCSGNQLSSDFNEEDVKKAAENVIVLINNEDSSGLRELFNTQLNTALTDDVLKQIYGTIREGGQFEKIEDMSVIGTTDKSTNQEYAVVVAKAKYKNKTFTYTISFDKQMKLAGLYYK